MIDGVDFQGHAKKKRSFKPNWLHDFYLLSSLHLMYAYISRNREDELLDFSGHQRVEGNEVARVLMPRYIGFDYLSSEHYFNTKRYDLIQI